MSVIKFTYTPKEEFAIAQESITAMFLSSVDEMKGKLMQVIPAVIRGFAGAQDLSGLPKFEDFSKEEREFLKHIQVTGFAELRELGAQVPEGLNSTYLEYIEVLSPTVLHLATIIPHVLQPYTVFLAELISHKSAMLSTNTKKLELDKLQKQREACYDAIGKLFYKGNTGTSSKYGKVVDRNNDWPVVFQKVQDMTRALQGVKLTQVKELTKQCADYLEVIHGRIAQDEMNEITPEVTKALADGAYQVAAELEFLSIIYYRVLALQAAVAATVSKVNEILE